MNVEHYRDYAADCIMRAAYEETPEDRNLLLNVALAWVRLARQTQTVTVEAVPDDADAYERSVRDDRDEDGRAEDGGVELESFERAATSAAN
jgi:hypothetical protein